MSLKLLYLDTEALNHLYAQRKPFVIAFMREHCPDCSFLMDHFLYAYCRDHALDKPIYVYEFERNGYYDMATHADTETYRPFTDRYGMSVRHNIRFGYGPGYVPTFMFIRPDGNLPERNPDVIADMCVVYNDHRDFTLSENTIISETFFDGTRPLKYTDINLKGRALPAWKRSEIGVYHNELLRSFLDKYMPLVG